MLKNSSRLAVSVPVNLSIKLDFVSVNGSRETYFVDVLRIISMLFLIFKVLGRVNIRRHWRP